MQIFVTLLACPDRPGLVHQISGELARRNLNVTETHEYVDHSTNRFFMRTQFEGSVNVTDLTTDFKRLIPDLSYCQIRELKPRRLVVMASREIHCLGDLLIRHYTKELRAEIVGVLSQHDDCGDLVSRFGLSFQHIPVTKDRAEHEGRVLAAVKQLQPDYLVLARYMRIFSKEFISHLPQKILNIHHSFLPAFVGRDPYEQAHARGVKIIGATAHFVIESLDQGPIITQDVIEIDHSFSPEQMAKKGQDVEKQVLARALNLILEDRVMIDQNRTVIFGS